MKWTKKGLIYCASDADGWAMTHASQPTPYRLNKDILRIFCSFCDKNMVSRLGYVDVLANNPKEIVAVSKEPVLDIGMPGMFDDNGLVPTSLVAHDGAIYIYYNGFQLGVNVRYTLFEGLAISRDNGKTFARYQPTPVLDRTPAELFFRTASHVIVENGIWKMWYTAGSEWVTREKKQVPTYVIKYLESSDGFNWGDEGKICFALHGDEHGFGRPCVVNTASGYKMFYTKRAFSTGYRLGYAQSQNGTDWIRKDDEIGIEVSQEGWDSLAICYSSVMRCDDKTYMFYCGNDFGRTGFGYAELDGSL